MRRSQIPDVIPQDIDVLIFAPTNNMYLVDKHPVMYGTYATWTCHQVMYDPDSGDLMIGPECTIEDEIVLTWAPDKDGVIGARPGAKNWRRVDWRRIQPEIILAFQDLLGGAQARTLAWFKDENIETALRKGKVREAMGEPTSPGNPEICGEPKVQILKPHVPSESDIITAKGGVA